MVEGSALVDLYERRRQDLETQLQSLRAEVAKEQLRVALFATDAAAATSHDVATGLLAVASEMNRKTDKHLQRMISARTDLQASIAALGDTGGPHARNLVQLLGQMAQVRAQVETDRVALSWMQWELLNAIGAMWFETLDDLYSAPDRKVFFGRLKTIVDCELSQVPFLGTFLDAVRAAIDVYYAKSIQWQNADEYFLGLESYIDAANLYLTGVLSFCAQVDALLADAPLPTAAEIQERIKRHLENVAAGRHGASPHQT